MADIGLDQIDTAEAQLPNAAPSTLNDEALYLRLKNWFLKDAAHSEEWREQARQDFDFVAGDQWEPNSYNRMLKDEKRVPVTFNKTATFLRMISGLEINGRHEIVFLPRGTQPGPILLNEELTQASKWMADTSDAEQAESAAFEAMATCGMGWVEPRIDLEMEEEGTYAEDEIDPLDMYWDKSSRKKNLSDAQRVARVRKMRIEDARALVENMGGEVVEDADLDAAWAIGVDTKATQTQEQIRLKEGAGNTTPDGQWEADPNKEIHIIHFQWWERETYYRVEHPQTKEEHKLDKNEFNILLDHAKAAGVNLRHVRQTRRVYKQAIVGGKLLWKGEITAGCFTYQCMTGMLHKSKGTWFGIVKFLRDPQMWSNKMFSQVLHILNTTAKGGIIAERSAFTDIREAQRTYARPDAITTVADGAITNGKIMAKPGAGLAAPFLNLMEYSDKNFYTTTGINIEIMGMRDAQQPGVLEAQRKQAGMTILATLFDSRKFMLKQVGKIRLHFIQNYLSDGRLMRIVGPDGYQAIPLMKDKMAGMYDVDVSDAPTSPDIKNQTWQMLMQLAPFLKGSMTPGIASIFLQYSPLPTKAVNELKQAMTTVTPEQQMQKQIMAEGAQAKVEKEKAGAAQAASAARRNDAASARDLASAVLDIAQAGGMVQQQQAAAAENMLLANLGGPSMGAQQGMMVHEPQAQPQHTLPQPAPLPQFGTGVQPQQQQHIQQLMANPRIMQAFQVFMQQQAAQKMAPANPANMH